MQNKQPTNLQTLKADISLSNSDLNELAHNHQKFVGIIRKFNNQAKAKILSDRPKQALIYLTQAEKILEYAASCGKNIDRNIIVCVLHNQACCYQKLWDLQKCSNYLQALIFNISSHLKTSTPSPRQVQDYIKTSGSLSSHLRDSLYGKPINQRIQLSKYHLQFCAINSQLRNHKGALVSGRRAIAIIKDIFQQLQTLSIEKSTIQNSYNPAVMCPQEKEEDYQRKLHMIAGIAMINDQPNTNRIAEYISTAKLYFSKWNIHKNETKNQTIKQSLKNFSIGTIMQIRPVQYQEKGMAENQNIINAVYEEKLRPDLLKTENLEKVINHALLLTIGYFTIATQLRLIAAEKYRTCQQTRKTSSQYLQSQIYHIISLIVTSIYVPYDMIYMRHILTSFSNHYSGSLSYSDQQSQHNQQQNAILSKQFDPCSFCLGNKKRNTNTNAVKGNNLKKKKSLALDFVNSIRIGEDNMFQRFQQKKGRFGPIKASLKKNNKNSSKSSKKNQHLKTKEEKKSMKHSKSKQRVHSEQLVKIQEVCESIARKNKMANLQKRQGSNKKGKVKSLTHKNHKSSSNNNSKTKKKAKKLDNQEIDKPNQYYRSLKFLQKSKSPRGTAGKSSNNHLIKQSQSGGMQKSAHNTQNSAHLKNQRVYKAGSGSGKIEKKKGAPLKKNLDKYYF